MIFSQKPAIINELGKAPTKTNRTNQFSCINKNDISSQQTVEKFP